MGVPAWCPLPEMGGVGGRLWLPQRRGAEGFCPQLCSGDAQGSEGMSAPLCVMGWRTGRAVCPGHKCEGVGMCRTEHGGAQHPLSCR